LQEFNSVNNAREYLLLFYMYSVFKVPRNKHLYAGWSKEDQCETMASSTQESHGASAAEEDAADAGMEEDDGGLHNPRRFFSIDAAPELSQQNNVVRTESL
jgi:hypothetical protein